MKIEIAEQMMASYLQNIEMCQVVQTNWRPNCLMSDETIRDNTKKIEELISIIRDAFPDYNIFGKNRTTQFISQAEIDVVGVKKTISNNGIYDGVFLVDTAFHKAGLNYKDCVSNVIKKLVRATIIAYCFFKYYKPHIWFLTPKIQLGTASIINECMIILKPILEAFYPGVNIELYLGDDCKPIGKKLVALSKKINDDNDLFLRSIQLLDLLGLINCDETFADDDTDYVDAKKIKSRYSNKEHILSIVEKILKENRIEDDLFKSLCDRDFTQKTFGISSFPFFKKASDITGDEKLKSRYYPQIFIINETNYRVVSQWLPERIEKFDDWVSTLYER